VARPETDTRDDSWKADTAHQQNVEQKIARKRELLAPWVSDQRVLHLGAGGGSVGRPSDDVGWLHGWLDAVASEAVGLDVDDAAVTAAQRQGFDLRSADVQAFDLDASFDVVVATDVLEHVTNPGQVLDRAHAHLVDDGELLVTTPRMTIPWWTLQGLVDGGDPEDHPEHVAAFTRHHLKRLLDRHGFDVVEYESWGFDRQGLSAADRAWRLVEKQLARVVPSVAHVQHFIVATADGGYIGREVS
jgi:predicted TPR repeat methyltransferase